MANPNELETPKPEAITPTPEAITPTPEAITPTPESITPTPENSSSKEEKKDNPEPPKHSKLKNIFEATIKEDDDPLLKLVSRLQNMVLDNLSNDKFNLPKAIMASPEKIIDTGKKIMGALGSALDHLKTFLSSKTPNENKEEQAAPGIKTPDIDPINDQNPQEQLAENITLTALSNTQTQTLLLDKNAENTTKANDQTAEIKKAVSDEMKEGITEGIKEGFSP